MGSKNSKAESLQYDAKEWQEVEKSTLHQVMRSKRGEEGYLHHFNMKQEFDIEEEVDIYHRRKSPANWVQILGANVTKSGFGFCGTQENVCVLTEPIPFLLNQVHRLNKQQSAVFLYNALRGYSDISRIVVPGAITDRMIGFNKSGQTKVWVNENFGMNHPGYHHSDALLDEAVLLNNLVNAVSPKLDLAPDFLNGVRNSRTLGQALSFVKTNSGVPDNILESNQINLNSLTGKSQVPVLRDTTQIHNVQNVQNVPNTFLPSSSTFVQNPQVYYQPQVGHQTIQSGYRATQPINFVQPSVNSSSFIPSSGNFQTGYQIPRYNEPVGQSKYSFNVAQ